MANKKPPKKTRPTRKISPPLGLTTTFIPAAMRPVIYFVCAQLNQVLSSMIPHATVIDNAFAEFANNAQIVANRDTDPSTRAHAIKATYRLLRNHPTLGPDSVLNALVNYQRYTLGFGGSRGVLSFVPQMVQSGWQHCSTKVCNEVPTICHERFPRSENRCPQLAHDSDGRVPRRECASQRMCGSRCTGASSNTGCPPLGLLVRPIPVHLQICSLHRLENQSRMRESGFGAQLFWVWQGIGFPSHRHAHDHA